MRNTRSRKEVEDAIRGLSDANWIRLKSCANFYARTSLGSDDLLQEAFCRALEDDRRKCPVDVDIVRFLAQAMRSIAHGEHEKLSNRLINESESIDNLPVKATENIFIDDETADNITTKIMSLFDDDLLAKEIIEGLMVGLNAAEIRELTDIDKTSYESKRRLIRRRVTKHFPNGWTL